MIFRFSQKDISKERQERIKKLWRFVQVGSAKDLCVKVFFYNRDKYVGYRGNYRNINQHGFYKSEMKLYQKYNITHMITLKMGRDMKDENIIFLMAHEWRHYKQSKKGKLDIKYFRAEPDANKHAKRRKEAWLKQNV